MVHDYQDTYKGIKYKNTEKKSAEYFLMIIDNCFYRL